MDTDYTVKGLEHELPVPKAKDYHGHPKYLKVFIILLVLLGVSLLSDFISAKLAVILLVFGAALIKASLVIGSFMHLKYENLFIWIITFGVVLFILIAIFWGMYPDFVLVDLDLAPK